MCAAVAPVAILLLLLMGGVLPLYLLILHDEAAAAEAVAPVVRADASSNSSTPLHLPFLCSLMLKQHLEQQHLLFVANARLAAAAVPLTSSLHSC